jgi:hypothetical protein
MGMPVADPSFTWQDAAVAFVIVAVAAFLVTWIVTDLLHVRRTPYIAILTLASPPATSRGPERDSRTS